MSEVVKMRSGLAAQKAAKANQEYAMADMGYGLTRQDLATALGRPISEVSIDTLSDPELQALGQQKQIKLNQEQQQWKDIQNLIANNRATNKAADNIAWEANNLPSGGVMSFGKALLTPGVDSGLANAIAQQKLMKQVGEDMPLPKQYRGDWSSYEDAVRMGLIK